jgi:LysR family glycine cleavage system transcriptional activator
MRNLNSLPLAALRTVEAIGRNGTLSAAAEEIGVTPGALSQRLAKAENALGQVLFLRQSTGLTPTETCRAILPRLTLAMGELNEVVSYLRKSEENTIAITMAPNFAGHWFVWRVKRFLEQHPAISIRVESNLSVVDLDASPWDIGIRLCTPDAVGTTADKLLDEHLFLVCSPSVANTLKRPSDILSVPIIRDSNWGRGWQPWIAAYGLCLSDLQEGPTYNDGSLCLNAAINGQGAFMAWETLACDALAQRHVVSPFELKVTTGEAYWLETSRAAANRPIVLAFKAWLRSELQLSIGEWRKG